MNRSTLAITFVFMVGSAAFVRGANQFFMPGDAFFHTVLTEQLLDEMDASASPIFDYDRPDFLPQMFCGYAGYRRLQYTDMPPAMKKHLRDVYNELREFAPKHLEVTNETVVRKTDEGDINVPTGKKLFREINGFSIFFYNESFDYGKHRLALKYNERWADDFAASGHKREHARLETFVPTPEAIAEDWRDGANIKPLKVKRPPMSPKTINVPLEVNDGVVAILVSQNDFKRVFQASPSGAWGDSTPIVYAISAKGAVRLYGNDGTWTAKPPKSPFDE